MIYTCYKSPLLILYDISQITQSGMWEPQAVNYSKNVCLCKNIYSGF